MQYRRTNITGATYFFTVNLANRKNNLLINEIDKLRNTLNKVKKSHPFKLDAMVILPEHLHAIFTLPKYDNNFAKRWSLIKAGFSRQLPKREAIGQSRKSKGERGIWQRRYWEHLIRDEKDFEKHVNYIHYNPVKHGYVKQPKDWKYSTIHKYIEKGILKSDWGYKTNNDETSFGER
jgi:putative transposase